MAAGPDTTQDGGGPPSAATARGRALLFVVFHGDRPLGGSSRYDLSGLDAVSVGRGVTPVAERRGGTPGRLELRFPGTTMSAAHARLEHGGGGWTVVDQESRNGTFVNGERVTRAVLCDGDLLEVGSTLLIYRVGLVPGSAEGGAIAPDLHSAPSSGPAFTTLVPAIADQLAALERIARLPISVLLLGESGTGKEVLGRSVHRWSGRPGGFVAVNCGGIAATLLESQLFGHVKGAFTGAARDEPGLVRAADHGTLFLDEIGDLPLPAQAALLRVLQEREVVPVGGSRPVKVDLRIVAATHRPLDRMVSEGTFRADLLARLSGYRHVLPPLRARREDLGVIVGDLLRRIDLPGTAELRFATAAARRLFAYDWPLNIRELEQCLTVAVALASRGVVEADQLPIARPGARVAPRLEDPAVLRTTLVALLEQHHGNISHVARDLGKARMQIHRWLQRFELDPRAFRS